MSACAFKEVKSSPKSANGLFELGLYPLLISLKARGLCGKEDECFGIRKEPIMGGRSCPTERAKASQRCEARWAITSKMNFPPELCHVSVGSDSSASDNQTCQRQAGGSIEGSVYFCVYVHIVLYGKNAGRKQWKQGSRVQILIQWGVSFLQASLGKAGINISSWPRRPKVLTQALGKERCNFLDLWQGKVKETIGKIFKYGDKAHGGWG